MEVSETLQCHELKVFVSGTPTDVLYNILYTNIQYIYKYSTSHIQYAQYGKTSNSSVKYSQFKLKEMSVNYIDAGNNSKNNNFCIIKISNLSYTNHNIYCV